MFGKKQQSSSQVPDTEVEDVMTNQTQFGIEKPLFEEPPHFVNENAPTTAVKVKKKKPILLYAGGGILLLFMIMLIGLALLKKKSVVITTPPVATPIPATDQATVDAYLFRLNELQNNFRDADPAQTNVPFPPVSLDISLDAPAK